MVLNNERKSAIKFDEVILQVLKGRPHSTECIYLCKHRRFAYCICTVSEGGCVQTTDYTGLRTGSVCQNQSYHFKKRKVNVLGEKI